MYQLFKKIIMSTCLICFLFGNFYKAFGAEPLPAYGKLTYAIASGTTAPAGLCTATSPTTLTVSAIPFGYGYSDVQYNCTVSIAIIQTSSGAGTRKCVGNTFLLNSPAMHTNGFGTLNAEGEIVTFASALTLRPIAPTVDCFSGTNNAFVFVNCIGNNGAPFDTVDSFSCSGL